jgi:triosephosphate isomerase (TIM)
VRRKVAAGNWKMNGMVADLAAVAAIADAAAGGRVECLLCLPATLIAAAAPLGLPIGAQDCHAAAKGAHTGDLSAPMLADVGARFVIVGHSERRANHGETDAMVAAKVQAVWAAGLTAILCIGETEAQYRAGQTLAVLAAQLAGSLPDGATPANTLIAYEPVWAIGTGLTPPPTKLPRPMRSSGAGYPTLTCRSFMAGRSRPATRQRSLPLPMSMAGWSGAPR